MPNALNVLLTMVFTTLLGMSENNIYAQTFTPDKEYLLEQFDSTIAWLDSNIVTDQNGYIISYLPITHYEIILQMEPLPEGIYSNLPASIGYHTTSLFWDNYVLISEDLSHYYVSLTTDFLDATPLYALMEVPNITKWFATEIVTDSIQFHYGWLYANAWYAEALIDLYTSVGNQEYLDRARQVIDASLPYIGEDGKWMRLTSVDPIPTYIGMSQAILMRVLFKYLNVIPDSDFNSALIDMSVNYQHTTEGVYNHWTNSRVGGMIRDIVLKSTLTDYSKLHSELSLLYSRIEYYNGKIPYIIDEANPRYPDFRSTYQTYDTFLLALMANYSAEDIGFEPYFEFAFKEAQNVNYDKLFANNNAAARLAFTAYGIRSDSFMVAQQSSSFIARSPTNVRAAIAKLTAIAELYLYGTITDSVFGETPLPDNFLILYPNPFNSRLKIAYSVRHYAEIDISVYDLRGRLVKDLGYQLLNPGTHYFEWQPEDEPSGVYLVLISESNTNTIQKAVLLK